MKLYDEGKLRLDDEIGDLLPWYDLKQAYPESGPITVRSIMTHSSGLPRESAYPYWTAPEFDFPCREEVKEKLRDQETLYPASTYFQYSNLGLSLLGEIVEEVSGVPFDDYIEKNILKPLKMKDTRTILPENKYGKQLAVGYGMIDRQGVRGKLNIFQAEGIKPAAGFSSNVTDLAKFASWQFRLRDSKEAEVLKPSTLKYMHTVQWMDPDFDLTWDFMSSNIMAANGPDITDHVPATKRLWNLILRIKWLIPLWSMPTEFHPTLMLWGSTIL